MNLFQKLCHKLFGWDYAIVNYAFGYEVFRVITMPSGTKYIRTHARYDRLSERKYEPLTWSEE